MSDQDVLTVIGATGARRGGLSRAVRHRELAPEAHRRFGFPGAA